MKAVNLEDLSTLEKELLEVAEQAREKAYSPYSNFSVGAALLASSGQIISGANVENASQGLALCAERSALVRANAQGIRKFKKIAIITRGKDFNVENPTMPCGAYR